MAQKMIIVRRLCGLSIACVLLTGCGDSLSEPTHSSPEGVNLVIGDEQKLAEMLAAHKGQVVFVDYWALWCESCVEFFPHTVQTHEKYKDRGLATIAVNFDLLESTGKVTEFLADERADFDNLQSNYDDIGQEVADAFLFDVLPQFRLYDRTGKVRYEWKEKPTDLDRRIEELLAETT
jgi:thiol-disulfide isomerase/thioredoxin